MADVVAPQSLSWLWQTAGATCCWALSDIVCDICIGQDEVDAASSNPTTITADKENVAPLAAKVDGTEVEPLIAKEEVPQVAAGLKKRQRRGTVQPHPQPLNSLTAERRATAAKMSPKREQPEPAVAVVAEPCASNGTVSRLSPEQNALLSGFVALLTVAGALAFMTIRAAVSSLSANDAAGDDLTLQLANLMRIDETSVLAALGGVFHFTAYLSTLCAFGSASSTVITPLMQLSAVWMLPFSTAAAFLGESTLIHPLHLLSVVLICAGGFLPAAGGSLSSLLTKNFWKQDAIRYVALGELLICCYNLILHQATFGKTDPEYHSNDVAGTMRFFLVSRTFNGLTSLFLFATVPWLRSHAVVLRHVSLRTLFFASVGECLSMVGVCLVTFSYSSFYEPSVVNAVEGGLQQLLNLLFALLSHSVLGFGKKVDFVFVKCISFVLVVSGLALSTV